MQKDKYWIVSGGTSSVNYVTASWALMGGPAANEPKSLLYLILSHPPRQIHLSALSSFSLVAVKIVSGSLKTRKVLTMHALLVC
jgi:hypothetical protein